MSTKEQEFEDRIAQLEAVVRIVVPDWRTCHTCCQDLTAADESCHELLRKAYFEGKEI